MSETVAKVITLFLLAVCIVAVLANCPYTVQGKYGKYRLKTRWPAVIIFSIWSLILTVVLVTTWRK